MTLPIDADQFDGPRNGWELQSVTVKAQGDNDNTNANSQRDVAPNIQNPGNPANRLLASRQDVSKRIEIQAVVGNVLDRVNRYQAQLKRDLYRAIETLRQLQADRLGVELEE